MKTKLQKLKDIDFRVTITLILIAGFSMLIEFALVLYAEKVSWLLAYTFAGAMIAVFAWKGIIELLKLKYQDE